MNEELGMMTVPDDVKDALKTVMEFLEESGGARDMMMYVPNDEFTYFSALVSFFGKQDYELEGDSGAH